MKRLVLESTAPFQGLPELVAYDEGRFERKDSTSNGSTVTPARRRRRPSLMSPVLAD
jgi:hypothetical protein